MIVVRVFNKYKASNISEQFEYVLACVYVGHYSGALLLYIYTTKVHIVYTIILQ